MTKNIIIAVLLAVIAGMWAAWPESTSLSLQDFNNAVRSGALRSE